MKLIFSILISLFFTIHNSCEKKEEIEEVYEIRSAEGDYFVSPDGDDNNQGTEEKPWKTIQKAVNSALPGKVVIVKQGFYDEYVNIKQNGINKNNPTIFFSEALHGASCRGFNIRASFINIDGFTVEAMGKTNWTGITINKAAYVTVQNCFIQECPIGGIKVINLSEHISLLKNKLEHNGQNGISLIANNSLIEENEIYRTVQYHPKGNEPGFSGADADGMRIFGNNNIIRFNIIENIADPDDDGNIDPHADCIQSWDGGSGGLPVMSNTIIEKNKFSVKHSSGKGIIIDVGNGGNCHNLIIRNNIFEFRDIGLSFYNGNFANIFVYNNVFKAMLNDKSWGTSASFKNIDNYMFINNITVDCHPQHRYIVGGDGTIDYNLAWNSDGSPPSYKPNLQAHELHGKNPKFSSYTEDYGANDYHLLSNSPAIDKALALDGITDDLDSVVRPQGNAYDIGPYEYKENK